jgi:hypothetical protein
MSFAEPLIIVAKPRLTAKLYNFQWK